MTFFLRFLCQNTPAVLFFITLVNPGVMNVKAMSLDFRDTPYQFTGALKAQKVARLEKLWANSTSTKLLLHYFSLLALLWSLLTNVSMPTHMGAYNEVKIILNIDIIICQETIIEKKPWYYGYNNTSQCSNATFCIIAYVY